jgi:ring-1,2-phenylacetyl-CoA epoxidase subunit PaaD
VTGMVSEVVSVAASGVIGDPARARAVAGSVCDPEIPVISIADLGVLRAVDLRADGTVEVAITPTYSGCPALDAIRTDVERALHAAGFARVNVRTELAPAWGTDQITAAGREALRAYGIAPPAASGPVAVRLSVRCPQCGSPDTEQTSRFAATACKALWRCRACREPFEQFKTLS